MEKLGGNDPCPCGSGRRFPPVLQAHRTLRRRPRPLLRPRLKRARPDAGAAVSVSAGLGQRDCGFGAACPRVRGSVAQGVMRARMRPGSEPRGVHGSRRSRHLPTAAANSAASTARHRRGP
ncbi:SEC-C metal-binding domain-containing protein [Actinomadura sp. GTD37]|uniref:SEC-C metal-binding domain-containing protein n=1 Tax=Actinomadura sp. GTD37 TaxID=1778030 RepID=UPI0035C21189